MRESPVSSIPIHQYRVHRNFTRKETYVGLNVQHLGQVSERYLCTVVEAIELNQHGGLERGYGEVILLGTVEAAHGGGAEAVYEP